MKSLAQNNSFYEWGLISTVYTVCILLNKQTWLGLALLELLDQNFKRIHGIKIK